jgi:hypothetical protein
MKTKLALLAATLVFVAGTIIYSYSALRHDKKPLVVKPFVVTFSRYHKSNPAQSEMIIQLTNSRGKSLIKRIGRDGREVEHFVPQFPVGGWADRAAYLESPYVIRTDQILGYTVYVFRADVGGQVKEEWFAPETGPVSLKLIIETPGADTLLVEATNIEFREVSDDEVEPQRSLIVHYPE